MKREKIDLSAVKMYDWQKIARDFCGYQIMTTFGHDFDIADHFGPSAVRDTFRRAFKEWRGNYKFLTELVLVLNWKCALHHETSPELCELYAELYHTADAWALDNLTGAEKDYYLTTTD